MQDELIFESAADFPVYEAGYYDAELLDATMQMHAPDAYKDVGEVVGTCHGAGLGKMVARLRPIGCVKG